MAARKKNSSTSGDDGLPQVSVSDDGVARYLHLGTPWVQGSMKLKMRTAAIEINPLVVNICRSWFKLPPDNDMLEVVLGDASLEILQPRWQGAVDALQVDLYDHNAAAPVLDSVEFYADCRAMLTPEGSMTVNLFGRASSYQRSLDKITEAFGAGHVWAFRPTREGNTIVLAQRVATPLAREELQVRAEAVQARWGLPATKWLKVFKRIEPAADLSAD